jgi:hypothetical protein
LDYKGSSLHGKTQTNKRSKRSTAALLANNTLDINQKYDQMNG